MNIDETSLPGVKLVTPKVFGDARGFFIETFSAGRYADAGIGGPFVQDNWSRSAKSILRGLHLQHPDAQGKLVSVMSGAVYDVAVDVRVGSPHFGRWFGCELSELNKQQLWIPPGFAHGFCVLSDAADFVYKCTQLYAPQNIVMLSKIGETVTARRLAAHNGISILQGGEAQLVWRRQNS